MATRARKPRGPARQAHEVGDNTKPFCHEPKCGRRAIVFHFWNWWCRKHDPGHAFDPACSHSGMGPVNGGPRMCAWCGGSEA